ncbi:hypothetical protein LCGC14_0901510 [marine sediment metagenome]|uniref:Helix-hairpin-helix DNA-binding motif class 1 domain-containing protein n=1 Tax=marine sediment metagenome TaxID=412755 RepID=A0A0F9RFF5_9ZZZZ|nr:helix-hairpin-helix domain-containing protein [Methylophaga sp.]HEC58431.1 helix-hairpin-helix domain-containing protein [Methylophaga sp.]
MKFNKLFGALVLSAMLSMSAGSAYAMDKININTATQSELQSLNGVGEATAAAIVQYRENNGQFKSVEDLVNVKGIGSKKVANLADELTVSDKK